jgi:hypothetical protein
MLLGTAAAASASLYTVQFVTQMAPRRAIYCELSGIVVSIIGLAYMAINGTALVAATSYLVSGFTVLFVARLFWKRSVSETKLQQLVFAE